MNYILAASWDSQRLHVTAIALFFAFLILVWRAMVILNGGFAKRGLPFGMQCVLAGAAFSQFATTYFLSFFNLRSEDFLRIAFALIGLSLVLIAPVFYDRDDTMSKPASVVLLLLGLFIIGVMIFGDLR